MLNLLKFVSVFSFESNWSGGKGNGAPTLGTKRRCEQLLAWVLEKDNDKSQLSRWSCWKDNIHEEEKCMNVKSKLVKEGCKKGWSGVSEPTVKQNGKTAPPSARWRTRPTSATKTPTPSSAQDAVSSLSNEPH